MFNFLTQTWSQIVELNNSLSVSRRVAITGVAMVSILGILAVAYFSSKPDYQILFAGLEPTDSQSITQGLTEDNVPFKVSHNGTAVMVPADKVHKMRLKFATAGLPTGGTVGFEIFSKSTFGMTEFVQKINFKRALQGELARTVSQFKVIKSARVHIATPERKLFSSEQDKTTASVVIKMATRGKLKKEQVQGIVHLVASSVENLSPENVTVIDTNGNVLSGGEASDETARLSSTQFEYRKTVEKALESNVTTMLEKIVGQGKVVSRANADIDFTRAERTEKKFDPNSQVARSEQRSESKSQGAQSPFGVPGTQSNLPGGEQAGVRPGKPATSNDTQETINYEINEIVSRVVTPVGVIKKLSMAVIVDGKYETDEEGKKKYIPRSAEELKQLSDLTLAAAGINIDRGDKITVESVPFDTSLFDEMISDKKDSLDGQFYFEIIKYVGMGLLAILMFLFVIRPVIGWITSTSSDIEALRSFPQTVSQMEEQISGGASPTEHVDYRTRVTKLFQDDPKGAAEMIRAWLRARR
ncbi:Flagellar M-ring protein FliF [hydrothermal vent metagenome]|uniref:Flagellar M-ring protein FliF n=1 Tax=hydrothermal vent metagenome TaxID=652676 RepID=A0A3B1C9Z9_9ZZZZ